jgi:hypothetical protein
MADATSVRVLLQTGGYCPIPVAGKVPAMREWQKHFETNRTEIELWNRVYPDATNTGILTGRNPTIDIDILNAAAAEAIEALAREHFEERGHFLVRIGKWPKRAILLRTDKPFPKITRNMVAPSGATGEKIEVLGLGQQVVVFGIHPDTKYPYLWHGGEPGPIKYEDLPYVRSDELVAFLDAAVALLAKDYGYTGAAERPKATNGAGARGPQDWGYLQRNILTLTDLHDSSRDLAAKYAKAGMAAGSIVNVLRGLFEASDTQRDAARQREFEARYADIPRAVDSALRKYGRAPGPEEPAAGEQPADELPEVSYPWEWGEETERDWLVRRLFVRVGLTFLGGAPGTGKSTAGVDVAASLITGMQCIGREVMHTGAVLMFLGEGGEDVRRAWRSVVKKKVEPYYAHLGMAMPEQLPFGLIDDPPMLTDPNAAQVLVGLVEREKQRLGREVVLLIFDNFTDLTRFDARANQTYQNANAMKPVREVMQKCDCAVLIIDHTGKDPDKGLRDSSVKPGKGDLILITNGKMGELKGTLKVEKSRSGVAKQEIDYEIIVHSTTGSDGLENTETTIEWHVEELPAAVRRKIDEKAVMPKAHNSVGVRRLLECIDEVMATSKAVELPLGSTDVYTLAGRHSGTPTMVRAVDQDDVWQEFLARQEHEPEVPENRKRGTATAVLQGVEDSKKDSKKQRHNTARKLWRRAWNFCVVNHLIGSFTRENSTFVWRTPKDSRGTARGQRFAVPGGQDSEDSKVGA